MAIDNQLNEKIRQITKDPNYVRNICTSAHIHHGKCVAGDSKLILAGGNVKTAKEIFEETAKDGEIFQETEEYTIFSPNKKKKVFSLNKENGKIEVKEIQHAWRLLGGKTIKIKLRNGFCIETTPEHKYIISKGGNFEEIEAKELKLGDRIVCARKLNIQNDSSIKKEILEKLSNENFYVNLNMGFHNLLKKRILEYGIKKLKENVEISIRAKSFYHGIWQNRYNLCDLVKICKLFNIDLEKIYNKIEFIFYRTGKQRGHNSLKMRLPDNFEEFFYLAGLFLGDGSERKFIVGKEELGYKLNYICGGLGIKTTRRQWKGKTPEIHTNLTLVYALKALFDYPLRKKSHNIKISDFVNNSEDKYVASLLKGYFDTDGCIERSRRAITISSASKKMIEDMHLLLLRFGCISIKEKDSSLSISGLSALNFKKYVGFGLKEKAVKLDLLVKKVSGSIVCDTIKVGDQVMIVNKLLGSKSGEELAFIEVKSIEQSFQDIVYDFTIPETHNFIAEGMVIHNTAMTDNLLAAAGLMSEKNAGDLDTGMATWQHSDEQERLLTVDAANVSMVHSYNGHDYLINLIDTPGHVDFGGNVTRAMRAVDGTIVLVCASEGIMPQTENVVKQAIRERVKPVLFINKVDRLIKEMSYTPEQMQQRFIEIINEFNNLVEAMAEPQYKEKWKVSIQDGSVAFGSARDNWAMSLSFMQKKGVNFKDILKIYELNEEERKKWVWENAPLYEVMLDMVIKHLPTPTEAQKYRIPKIWRGDLESDFGKDLVNCNPNGKLAFCITRVLTDLKSQREIAAGRLFSGTIRNGMQVYLNMAKKYSKIQQVLMYNGVKTQQIDEVVAGNVLGLMGLDGAAGETVTLEPEQPFEELKHIFEPVITQSIEPTKASDLPKLVEVLRQVSKEDPSIKIEINEETGENLMSGMGELHLEIVTNRIKEEKGVQVKVSEPIVVYREAIVNKSREVEGKSPNKHNKLYFIVEPLEENVYAAIKAGELPELRLRPKDREIVDKLIELGYDAKIAKKVKDIYKGNLVVDTTRGIVYINEIMELVLDGVEQVIREGPLAREPCVKMKVSLTDCKLHEDAIHRGPAQMLPAVREAIKAAMLDGGAVMYEPLQVLEIDAPQEYLGEISKLVANKRGQMLTVEQEGNSISVRAKLPVAEMFGLTSELRSATSGRGNQFVVDQSFEKLPKELQEKVITSIRNRKGLKSLAEEAPAGEE